MGSATMQASLWGSAPQDWANIQEPMAKPLWGAVLDAAGVSRGTRLLDAGCGAGGACVLAASRGALICGFDATETLLAIARQRVRDAEFRAGDLEELPYADGSFDAVIACNSVQFCTDPGQALAQLRRVCSGGGSVAVATWDSPEECESRDIFRAVVSTLPAPPPGEGPFALSKPGLLEDLLAKSGLRSRSRGAVDCPFVYANVETFWRGIRSAGPLQGAIRTVGEQRVKDAVFDAVRPYTAREGGVRLENRFVYVTASPD